VLIYFFIPNLLFYLQKIKIKGAGYFKNNSNSNESGWDYLYMSLRSKDSSMILVKDYEFKNPYIRNMWIQNDSLTSLSPSHSVTRHPLKNNKFLK